MLDLEDTLAQEEFGMMFDQLGDNEKEWVEKKADENCHSALGMLDLEDTLAMEEFGMMFDQLGDNEKEWVWDEMANMEWSKDVEVDAI